MDYIFVYGALKRGFRLYPHMEGSEFIGEAFLENYKLYEISWYPGIKKSPAGKVIGEVFKIDDEILKELDDIEEEGTLYKRLKEKVITFDGRAFDAWIYEYLPEISNEAEIKEGLWVKTPHKTLEGLQTR